MYQQVRGVTNGVQGYYSQASPEINGFGAGSTRLESPMTLSTLADPYVLMNQKQKYIRDNYQRMTNKPAPKGNIMRTVGSQPMQEQFLNNLGSMYTNQTRFTDETVRDFGDKLYRGFKNVSSFFSGVPQKSDAEFVRMFEQQSYAGNSDVADVDALDDSQFLSGSGNNSSSISRRSGSSFQAPYSAGEMRVGFQS